MARGEIIASQKIREHVRNFLRFQSEISRELRIQRQLQALRNDVPVPGGLVNRILDVVDTLDRSPAIARRRRSKFAGMCVVAIALLVGIGSRSGRRRATQAS